MRAVLKNLAEVQRKHEFFLALNEREMNTALDVSGRVATRFVMTFPRFTPRTGKTQKATKHRVIRRGRGGRVMVFTNTAKHAATLESGSRAHIIRGQTGNHLRFKGREGKFIFRRVVRHPGTKPYRFMSSAYQAGNSYFKRDMERRMTAISSRF